MTTNIDNMSVLERRRIEAGVLGPMLRAFEKEFGKEPTRALARRVITEIAQSQGKALAEGLGGDDLQTFASGKEPWTRGGALEIEVLESTERRYSFNVTRCRYAEMYKELGLADLGSILSCGRDFALSSGFNPRIKLSRTQTIMEGASHCNFRYSISEEPEDGATKGAD